MSADVGLDDRTRALLREAATWRLLGLFFERPCPQWKKEVEKLAAETDDQALGAAARVVTGGSEGAYLRCFGPGGTASAREVGYRPLDDPGRILAELRSCYDAFGFRPSLEEPPDHVAVETGFVAFLFLKEAYARAGGNVNGATVVRETRARFIAEHLCPLAHSLVRRLEADGNAALLSAARCLVSRLHPASRRAC